MSKMAILRSECFFASASTVMFSLLLKVSASPLSLSTHPLRPLPYSLIVAGRQPSGGRDVTPIRRAPNLYNSCTHSTSYHADEEIAVTVDVVAARQRGVVVVVLDEIAGPCADDIQRVGQDGGGILLADQRRKLGLVLLVVLELLRQSNCILQRKVCI
ncbi:Os06g0149133 [Oryza sativa Japonica Group]|uniref:Os06g0149133 protein n=1 Tax=Oryza sativa subsp. japonica TaxID=39947 RepID=A0A0P0WT36_ORYSJ|nr:hypothetical protein EE612_031941 [Oryza sativa]BAS96168.1 Os06g0149133 [Oryza sativa Japonica Group]